MQNILKRRAEKEDEVCDEQPGFSFGLGNKVEDKEVGQPLDPGQKHYVELDT